MGIKELIEDSDILIDQGKYESALSLLLIAVGASSVKLFPEGTLSIDGKVKDPKSNNPMRDAEKFARFLGGRVQAIMFGDNSREKERSMMLGAGDGIEKHLYENYRCSLIHEGKLKDSVQFVHSKDEFNFSYTGQNGEIKIDFGLLNFLRRVVTDARINGKLFNKVHYAAKIKYGLDEAKFFEDLAEEFGTSYGRLLIFKEAFVVIGPELKKLEDQEILKVFFSLVKNGLNVSGLKLNYNRYPLRESHKQYIVFPFTSPQLCQDDGILTNLGLMAFKKIIDSYDVIDGAE